MSSPYQTLHDSYVSNKRRNCRTIALAVACLTVLGILLAIAVLERPKFPRNHETLPEDAEPAEDGVSVDQCRMTLVESIPLHVKYEDNVTFGMPLEKAWNDLLSMTTQQIDVASFYWTLTGQDINVNSSSDLPGKSLLKQFEALPSRNVSVRVVTSLPSFRTNSTDLKILRQKGVHVRKVNFGRLTNGVLHSKFWIVDRRHVYIGSANMDWRALTEVKELGVVIYNCSSLAKDLRKIFQSYWVMGHPNSSLPKKWPSKFDTAINQHHPLVVKAHNVSSRIYLTASPPAFCPPSRTQDLEAILSVISGAQRFINVAVMDYFPSTQFEKPKRYWPAIDDAIRRAAFEQHIKIRMLISCGRDSDPAMLPFLESLASMHSPGQNISIQIKLYILPAGNRSDIPHSRVNHNKFMVTDKVAYVGTSNWSADYFSNTAGVALVVSQHAPRPVWKTGALQGQLQAVFERDWHSQFTVNLADLGHHPDCALLKG
ncbi:5'-3' exonuclease PLD4 [Lampris incognitus]|uniref:5'-3' exonuclease PLD4 n=1 Tax=Lampris incognitus TaxID=2546036 RepID=UPI0024B529A9|nr:5'-3' exonuclease PLD4 [Lampris incognitus]